MSKLSAKGKASLAKAVEAMRLHLRSETAPASVQNRIYNRLLRHSRAVADETGMIIEDIFEQIEAEAHRRGLRTPMPGKDY